MFRAGDRLSLAANAYYATVDDYIEQTVSVFAGTTTSANVASATLWGFEAEADYDAEAWFVGMGLSIARGENDAGGWLGSIPQDRLTLEAGVRPGRTGSLGHARPLPRRRPGCLLLRTPSDGYQLLDLYATWTPEGGPLGNANLPLRDR